MNKLKSTRIYGDLYIDGLAKVNSNDIITTTNLSSTIQTVSPNSLTTTGNRSYSIQRNASGQLVVNIPWTDTKTNWYPTSFSWTKGTTNGPVGSLTGTGMPNVSIGAIPTASNTESGIVTIGAQTFKGNKTFTDNVTLSGDLTVLGAMNVKNVNVLETSSGVIFEGGSGSGKVTMELATDPGTTSYSLKVPNKNGIIATDDIMTNTTPGLGKLFDNTVQSVAANGISKTASRTYGIQRNSDNQLVVNVPWEDNNAIYSAGNGLTLSGNAFSLPVSTSGTGTFVTGITQLTNGIQVNLGTPPNTNTHWTSKNVVGGSSTASTDGTSTNGNTYINHIESGLSSPTSSHNIVGTGATTVISDANGKITINSVDTKTNNYLTGVSGSGNGTVTFTRNGLSNLTWDASHTHDGDYTAVVNLTVATAAATAAKTTTETVTFQEGVIYFIRFTLGNSVSTVTLNGINMRLGTTNVSTTTMTLGANAVIPVYFDATANRLQITGSYRTSDGTESYTVRWNAAVKAGVQITRYKLLVQGEDNKYYPTTIGDTDGNTKTVSTVPFLIGAPILFYNTTTTVAANANNSTTSNYTGILTSSTARTWNQNSGWRAQEDVYLKGTISGSFFTLDNTTTTSHMTQDLPTTDDGFYYLRLGMMTNTTTSFKLSVEHPIYYFTNGELQLLAQQANAVKTYQKADNVNYNIPFVLDLTDDEFKRLYTDNSAHLTYNPSTNTLSTTTFSGSQLTSTVATGTAPLVVASTTPVENLGVRWANVADKPDPKITLTGAVTGSATMTDLGSISIATTHTADPTITLAGDLTGSATLTNLGSATLTATIAANSVALGTDTTGNYVATVSGKTSSGLSISGSGSENAAVTIGHSNILTSAGTRSGSSGAIGFGGTISIPSISYDINGHITSTTTTSVTLPANPNTDTKNTAGATDTSTKIFLVGAGSQTANPQTYTDNEVFVTNGKLDAREINTSGDVAIGGSLTVTGNIITNNVEMIETSNGVIFEGTSKDDFETTLYAINPTADRTIALPNASGTVALTSQINDASLTLTASAGATNTAVTIGTGTGFTANDATNTTYDIDVGPALTNLATTMTGATSGFLKKTSQDTYILDTNTYLKAHPATSPATSVNNSGRTYIQDITLDSFGHVTGLVSATESVTDTHHTATNFIGTTGTQTNASTTNGNTYLKLVENSTIRSSHKITGSGATTVSSDASGNITISSTDTNTVYTHPGQALTQGAGTETTLADITLIDSLTTNATGHLTNATWRKLVAGSNVTITPATNGNITISSTNTNTNTYPTAFAWSNGTTAGPTGSLTGTSPTVSFGAIPSASPSISGIVTTSTQEWAGSKTFRNGVTVKDGANTGVGTMKYDSTSKTIKFTFA